MKSQAYHVDLSLLAGIFIFVSESAVSITPDAMSKTAFEIAYDENDAVGMVNFTVSTADGKIYVSAPHIVNDRNALNILGMK